MPDLRLGNVFQLPSRRISRRWTRSGTTLVIFLEALCAKTNLFWREMKINKMYSVVINIKISAPLPLTSFAGKTSDGLAKCQLFPQAKRITILLVLSTNDH